MKNSRGFTLIELLVVLLILGIVVAFTLSNFKSAKQESTDSSIKAHLADAMLQSKFFVDSTSYTSGVSPCTAIGGMAPYLLKAAKMLSPNNVVGTSGSFSYNASGGTNSALCRDSGSPIGWAAIVSLVRPTTPSAGWCIDSTGTAKESIGITTTNGQHTCT